MSGAGSGIDEEACDDMVRECTVGSVRGGRRFSAIHSPFTMANDSNHDFKAEPIRAASDGLQDGPSASLRPSARSRSQAAETPMQSTAIIASDDRGSTRARALEFALEVECEFSAAHAILLGGVRERLHGHNWRVVVSVVGDRLDDEELLCDFHEVERMLEAIVAPFRDGNLNETPPFDRVNPTAEAVARHIATQLSAQLPTKIPPQLPTQLAERRVRETPSVFLEWVRVTEAPRCTAVLRFLR